MKDRKWLIKQLQLHSGATAQQKFSFKGAVELVEFLLWYFQGVKDDYEYTSILHALPVHVVEAMSMLSKGDLPETIAPYRQRYLAAIAMEDLPLLEQVGYGGVRRALLVVNVAQIMAKVTGEEFVRQKIEDYCFAEDHVLSQTFYRFFAEVGKKGLLDIYEAAPCACSGTFGQTDVRMLESAGRIMVTFARRKEGKTVYRAPEDSGAEDLTLPYIEESVTFIGDSSRLDSKIWGIQSCHGPFRLALEMIEDAITNWPSDPDEQKKLFKEDHDVSIGF